jgi:small subunit ribosomal protein S16
MPVKIRLQRHGKKGRPFFHIVVADSRAPRDGRFIERIGSYNPITDPATIELNTDVAASWMMNGAQPSETAKAILSYKGVLYRVHLNKGVAKGVMTQEQADEKFIAWTQEKHNKIDAKKKRLSDDTDKTLKSRLAAESKVKEARAEALKKKELEATFTPEAAPEEAAEDAAPAAEEGGEG